LRWVDKFNNLRKNIFIDKWSFGNHVAFMDLYIFKRINFHIDGKLSIKVYQKPENRHIYIFLLKTLTHDIPLKTT